MNASSVKMLKKAIKPYPNKLLLNELIKIHGEDKVLNGKIDMWKETKKIWKTKNAKEKRQWKQALA